MPNHIKHAMRVVTDSPDFWEAISSSYGLIDFNEIIPMPEHIKLPKGKDSINAGASDAAMLVKMNEGFDVFDFRGNKMTPASIFSYGHKRVFDEDFYDDFKRCCKAIEECGYSDWWPWSVVNWGTKWNAYSIRREGNTLVFETAWNTPTRIWDAIAIKFPNIEISVKFADEDMGSNCGTVNIKKGKVSVCLINTLEFAFDVHGYSDEMKKEYLAEIA